MQLIPGDPHSALARSANSLQNTDLVIISAGHDEQSLASAWFYLPRMLHAGSAVYVESKTSEASQLTLELLSPVEIEAKRDPPAGNAARKGTFYFFCEKVECPLFFVHGGRASLLYSACAGGHEGGSRIRGPAAEAGASLSSDRRRGGAACNATADGGQFGLGLRCIHVRQPVPRAGDRPLRQHFGSLAAAAATRDLTTATSRLSVQVPPVAGCVQHNAIRSKDDHLAQSEKL